jgi:hypothetical protein
MSASQVHRNSADRLAQADTARDAFQYETLEFRGRLEILDREGRVARFIRRQRIRFLEDNVTAFHDRIWGEGILFAYYAADGMRMLQPIRTLKGYVLPLALPRPFHKGEVFEVRTERRIVGAFAGAGGYWESAMAVPTDVLDIEVVTPVGLRCRRVEVHAPHRRGLSAGARPRALALKVSQPALDVPYRLSWSWN